MTSKAQVEIDLEPVDKIIDFHGNGSSSLIVTLQDVQKELDLKTFNTKLTMKSCAECGTEFATMELIENIKSKTRIEFPELLYDCCPACRQRLYSRKLASLKQA